MDAEHQNNSGNKLSEESSPYLLLHADNPVNWHPWGPYALELARKQDKPILLSIGYSACHWCHVMMRESFCDPDVAATMNRLFVNIKVDKEERPDLDKVYQTAYQLLMGQPGGWPLTMFLSPITLIPYYGGTYFPKEADEESLDFQGLLHKLNEVYYHSKEKVRQQEVHTMAILQIMMQFRPASVAPLADVLIHKAEVALQREFDPVHGGFGKEAKFPNCPNLEFILHSEDTMTRHIALTTLNHMAAGGINDQLAGGFFRYTVDDKWQIPHFEKMLYDNAQLVGIYAEAFQLTHKPQYRETSIDTGNWLLKNLLDPKTGGFYTAFDADTDEQEGLFYLWNIDEIKKLLTAEEFANIKKFYHLDHKANFDHKWHLYVNTDVPEPDRDILRSIKEKLLPYRDMRTHPALDNLILTGWNGLTIKGLSLAAHILKIPEFKEAADTTIKFIRDQMYVDGKLYATWQNGAPKVTGFLDDYAFVLDGILTFINYDPKHEYMQFCLTLADDLLKNFYDPELGGFYFSAYEAEKLFYKPKTYTDDSIPSGNGIACLCLLKLGKLCGKPEYIEAAKKTIFSTLAFLNEAPELHLNMCRAYVEIQED